MRNLKSSTAFLMCLVLIVPAPISAQSADKLYPCVSLSGDVVQNANQLSQALLAFLGGDEQSRPNQKAKPDTFACDVVALDEAIVQGGDELAAAMDAAPPDRLEMLREQMETAESAPAAANEQLTEAEASNEEAETVATAEPETDAEEPQVAAAPDATTETDAPVEEAEAVPEVEPETESEAVAETAPEAEATPVETEKTTEEIAQAVETEAPPQEEVTAESTPATNAGEAGGETLSDAERQALAQERADEQTPSAAAAAEQTAAITESEPEMAAETIAEEDVRSSAEDFTTSAAGDQPSATNLESEDKGLSKFEQALLLGVGAVIVGSILKNGDQVVSNSGDRVVVERDGELRVLKNDDVLLRRPGAEVQTQTFNDGSTRTVVSYEDGRQVITIRSPEGTVLRRTLIRASDGSEVVLFDDTAIAEPVDFQRLPELESIEDLQDNVALDDQDALRLALRKSLLGDLDRTFSLRQVREYKRVRALAPKVDLDSLTFETGSAAIRPSQAEDLSELGFTILQIIDDDPGAVFLVEGHTDAVGSASYNLALSDRRAETVALALTEYFDVPPQNLITQGYGESDLKIPVLTDERANRRAAVRNISDLLD